MWYFFLQCSDAVEWQEGHPACKKLGVGLLVVTIWQELYTSYGSSCRHHLLSSNKIQNGDILVSANPGPPGKWPSERIEREREREQHWLNVFTEYTHARTLSCICSLPSSSCIFSSVCCVSRCRARSMPISCRWFFCRFSICLCKS